MSEFSGRPQYDDPQSEEDEAVADSGTDLAYRRLAASSGEPGGDVALFYFFFNVFFTARGGACGGLQHQPAGTCIEQAQIELKGLPCGFSSRKGIYPGAGARQVLL